MVSLTNMFIVQLMQSFSKLDIGILKAIYENRNPVFDAVFVVITNSAGALAFGLPGILLIVALATKNVALRRNALLMLIPVAISAVVANILKYTIDLPRPFEVYHYIKQLSVGGSPTFPSGHTADAFAFATAASLVFRKWSVLLPSMIWAVLVGYSRMYLGVHFPSDVIAGAVVGATCSTFYYWLMKRNLQNRIIEE
jgi:membrane-associated phospholipid phosphatase